MWPSSSAARRERRLQQLQDTSNRYAEEAMLLSRAGRLEEALDRNRKSIDIIRQLRAEEPDNDEHLAQLAGKLYNLAGVLTRSGRPADAASAARDSLDSYLELTGGEMAPITLLGAHLDSLTSSPRYIAADGTPHRRLDLLKLSGMTADVKCRLATNLAMLVVVFRRPGKPQKATQAAAFGAEARRLVTEAVATYDVLTRLDEKFQEDLVRVRRDEALVYELIGDGA
ncbi:hypothetical protein AB0J90_05095 [Micromonospora sp. NPDC049523]|uniref:hypothetical protein n=1 Tax=Micromonospora sp. NPDC049523 TaxID=3155921 RepID=UPI003437CB52